MDLQYIKQTIRLLKEDPMQAIISVLGTALAIAMIVATLITDRADSMSFPPESNRGKTLYIKWIGLRDKETNDVIRNGYLSAKTIDECFRTLETPLYVTANTLVETFMASLPGLKQKRCYVRQTDDVFWQAYHFRFLEGSPYTKADFDAGIRKVVVSRKFIRSLLGSDENVTGREIQLNYVTYTIAGVVEDTSPLFDYTFANAWIPFTSHETQLSGDKENVTGNLLCQIIPRSTFDKKMIRAEIETKMKQFNITLPDINADLYGQPDGRFKETKRFGPGDPNMQEKYLKAFATILIVFLVPTINLSGFTFSRMRKRLPELGIRKAFGSTRTGLIRQIVLENVLYSLIGGLLGLMLSISVIFIIKGQYGITSNMYWGMDISMEVPFFALFNWINFLIAFGFCLMMNLVSACIPAWRMSSVPIVSSLNEQ